jgi:hypothetical protein
MTQQGQGVAQPPYPREPNVHSGGKQEPGGDRDLPPYEDRQKEGSGTDKEQLLQERGGVPGHEAGPRQVSEAESGGMTDTDMAPSGPLSGESTTTSGEEFGSGMSEEARKQDRFDGGIADSTTNVDPESPPMSTGDQGG